MPVIVTVTMPVVAVVLAVSVKALVAVAGFGLNDAVTPLGRPEADKLTLLLKLFWGVRVMVLGPLAPCAIVTLLGAAESVKSGMKTGFTVTVSATVVLFDKLPEVPVMITVTVPVEAVLLAVRAKELVFVVLVGLKEADTPLGRPEADKLTMPLKPFCGVTVIVLVPVAPCAMVRLLGDAEIVKFGTGIGFTVRETVAVFDKLPEVPVTVTVTVPVADVLLAVSVNVLVLVVLVGLREADTPLGRPEADKLTLPLKPFCGVRVIVLVPVAPCVMLRLLGDAEIVKFGTGIGFTVREIVVALDKLPEVPVMVTVTVPLADVLLAVSVNVLVLVVLVGLNEADTPLGKPEADKLTLPLKPLCGVTVMVLVALAPCVIVKLLGDTESTKLGVGEDPGQLLTKLAALRVPIPVAKSHPVVAG